MQNVLTKAIIAENTDERCLACNSALAEVDYLNLFLEQRVTECVLRNEKACKDMLMALDQAVAGPRRD